MRKIILKNSLSPGDILMLAAAVRDLHLSYPGAEFMNANGGGLTQFCVYFKLHRFLFVPLIALVYFAAMASGDLIPNEYGLAVVTQNPLKLHVASSDVILYGKVVGISGDGAPWPNVIGWTYTVDVSEVIKGTAPSAVQFQQGEFPLGAYGPPALVSQGDTVLLMLRNAAAGYSPVDPKSLIELPPNVSLANNTDVTPYDRVVDLILSAMRDPKYGSPASMFLQNVFDPRLINKVEPFVSSPNRDISGAALSDYVAFRAYIALSRRAGVSEDQLFGRDTYRSIRQKANLPIYRWWRDELNGVSKDHDVDAWSSPPASAPGTASLPSELRLYSRDVSVRKAEMNSLEASATQESEPYLLLALEDPQPAIQYRAYSLLCKLFGLTAGEATSKEFAASQTIYTAPLYKLWQKSLNGRVGS